jgi:hypothetical protein
MSPASLQTARRFFSPKCQSVSEKHRDETKEVWEAYLGTERLNDDLVRAQEEELRLEARVPERDVESVGRGGNGNVKSDHGARQELQALEDGRVS